MASSDGKEKIRATRESEMSNNWIELSLIDIFYWFYFDFLVVNALIEASLNKPESVNHSICNSLYSFGKRQPNLVIESILNDLKHESTARVSH